MINLFIPYYVDKADDRQAELQRCLKNNIANKSIGRIFITHEILTGMNISGLDSRSQVIILSYRPTYNTMFEIANSVTGPNDWNIIANSDIYFDDSVTQLNKYTHADFLALSRWDIDRNGNATHFNRWDSQDTWCFKGKVRRMDADFFQGVAGCDNAIAERAVRVGYNVINPSKTIKTYHLHNSGIRNYNPNNRVPKPYKFITPHE